MSKVLVSVFSLKALAMLGLLFITGCNKSGELVHLKGRTMGTQFF
jgi:hypothetical protein